MSLKALSRFFVLTIFFFFCSVSVRASYAHFPLLIFCFHDVDGKGRYSVTRKELVQIFDLLKNKYQILSLENWYNMKTAGKTRPAKRKMGNMAGGKKWIKPVVVLTFDDGFPSLFKHVIPLLEEYQYQATIFVYLNRYHSNSVFYKKLAKLPKKFEIGSHSFTHDKLSHTSDNIFKELYLSKKKLEYLVQRRIISWAWPYGHYTPELLEQARNAGYLLQVSTDYDLITPGDRYENMARYTVQHPHPVKRVKDILNHYQRYLKKERRK